MSQHLLREVENLKKKLITLSILVEENLSRAVRSIENRDAPLAATVVAGDDDIDAMEIAVEEECLKILALYQPVAADLRFIVAVLKINSDLERIGDLAVNIAERAQVLAQMPRIDSIVFDFPRMCEMVRRMLKNALDALIAGDVKLAQSVCSADDNVDALNREMFEQVVIQTRRMPEQVDYLLHHLSISRNLERIADHCTNIAEDVIYLAEGMIVRHHHASVTTN